MNVAGAQGPVVREALATLLGSRAREAVLRLFLVDPLRAYYQRQVEQATGLAIRVVQRELERLTLSGLLYRHAEGNRAYYQVDMQFPLFPELRAMILKMGEPLEQLRGKLALEGSVRLAFLAEKENRVLVVTSGPSQLETAALGSFAVHLMRDQEFVEALAARAAILEPFLVQGVDLLGRRDDVIWRRIESAGYSVNKGKAVP